MLKKYLVNGLFVLVIFLLIVGGRVFYLQKNHYIAAERYFSEANWKLAIREYDTAMHFYTPWSTYIDKSAKRLWQIGEMYERDGKLDWANIAYSSIRSSFYSSRSLFTPGRDWINKCDDKIADLNVKMLIEDGSIKTEEADAEKKKHLYVMKVDRAPNPVWSVLVEAGFFGWIASIIFLIFKGIDDTGKTRGRFALYGALSFIFSFAIWVVSLLKA
ncbi:MAG: hypothetical protein WC769_13095 [Thermodesulfovibrionales bacterium]|jgi:hypothetical protein